MTPSTTSAPQQRSPEAAANVSFEMSATTLNQGPQTIQSQLDRGAAELLENPKLLEVQVKSAKSHLQGKQKTPWKFSQMFIRGTEKCVLFAMRLAKTEQIVRKFLVTMSALVI